MKEYRLEVKVRNNAVLSRIEALGYDSVPAFCRDKNLTYHTTNEVIGFKAPFYNRFGRVNGTIVKLADALQVTPEYIYPPERRGKPLERNKYIIQTDKADLMQISTSLRTDALPVDDRKMLEDFRPTLQRLMIEGLTPKEHRVLDMRFGLTSGEEQTLEDVANTFNVSRERIRAIESKAIRKLKHPARSVKLREYLEFCNDMQTR